MVEIISSYDFLFATHNFGRINVDSNMYKVEYLISEQLTSVLMSFSGIESIDVNRKYT